MNGLIRFDSVRFTQKRRHKRLTIEELAKLAGVCTKTLSRARREGICRESALLIAAALTPDPKSASTAEADAIIDELATVSEDAVDSSGDGVGRVPAAFENKEDQIDAVAAEAMQATAADLPHVRPSGDLELLAATRLLLVFLADYRATSRDSGASRHLLH